VDEAALIQLVKKAIGFHGTTGCYEYVSDALQNRIRANLGHVGTPKAIKKLSVEYVAKGGRIDYRAETRQEYQGRRECWFRANVPVDGFPDPLFFELDLIDDDSDCPAVRILNVHF